MKYATFSIQMKVSFWNEFESDSKSPKGSLQTIDCPISFLNKLQSVHLIPSRFNLDFQFQTLIQDLISIQVAVSKLESSQWGTGSIEHRALEDLYIVRDAFTKLMARLTERTFNPKTGLSQPKYTAELRVKETNNVVH